MQQGKAERLQGRVSRRTRAEVHWEGCRPLALPDRPHRTSGALSTATVGYG